MADPAWVPPEACRPPVLSPAATPAWFHGTGWVSCLQLPRTACPVHLELPPRPAHVLPVLPHRGQPGLDLPVLALQRLAVPRAVPRAAVRPVAHPRGRARVAGRPGVRLLLVLDQHLDAGRARLMRLGPV